jgi:hypothetical protein
VEGHGRGMVEVKNEERKKRGKDILALYEQVADVGNRRPGSDNKQPSREAMVILGWQED